MKYNKHCKLKRCKEPFLPEHGNEEYCCDEHQEEAKLEAQKERRDPIKHFIPILMKNHERIETMFLQGMTEVTSEVLEAYAVDLSLCRHVKAPATHVGKLMLDFGTYYLITETDFLIFKLFKHDTNTAI
jgi:hypothetical protein